MKKLQVTIFVFLALVIFSNTVSHGAVEATGIEGIKVLVEGKVINLKSPPIKRGDVVYLPLREVSNEMGINDNNINWDESTRAITYKLENRTFNFRIGIKRIYINGERHIVDLRPVIYNNRAYVTLKTISLCFEQKAIWDSYLKMILICSPEKFNNNKEVLEKIASAMDLQINLNAKIIMNDLYERDSFEFKIDKLNKIVNATNEITKVGESSFSHQKSEMFIKDDKVFTKDYRLNKWKKLSAQGVNTTRQFFDLFTSKVLLSFGDTTYAAVNIQEYNKKELYIRSDVIFNKFLTYDLYVGGNDTSTEVSSVVMRFNKDTNLLKSLKITVKETKEVENKNVENIKKLVIIFDGYGDEVKFYTLKKSDMVSDYQLDYLTNEEFLTKSQIENALSSFVNEVGRDSYEYIKSKYGVEELIEALKGPITIIDQNSENHLKVYGPYIEWDVESGKLVNNKKSIVSEYWHINLNESTGIIQVKPSDENKLTVQ